jgi:general stress protein YciG
MAGTPTGGKQAYRTNTKNNPMFYHEIGKLGGAKGHTGGFAEGEVGRERARVYGAIGGYLSRRNGSLPPDQLAKKKAYILKEYADALERLTAIQQAARERRAKG